MFFYFTDECFPTSIWVISISQVYQKSFDISNITTLTRWLPLSFSTRISTKQDSTNTQQQARCIVSLSNWQKVDLKSCCHSNSRPTVQLSAEKQVLEKSSLIQRNWSLSNFRKAIIKTSDNQYLKNWKMIPLKTFAEGMFVQEKDEYEYAGFKMKPMEKEKVLYDF